MGDEQPFPDLGSQIQRLQQTWDIRARGSDQAGAGSAFKAGVRWAFRKGLGPPLDLQADLNWSLVAAISAIEEGLQRLHDGKGDRAELDAQAVRFEGLRLESERQWADTAARTDLEALEHRQRETYQAALEALASLRSENAALRDRVAALEARLDFEDGLRDRLAKLDAAGLAMRLDRLERRSAAPPPHPASSGGGARTPEPASGERRPLDYFKFEARFRGPREEIRKRHEPYVAYFTAGGPVLDIGFGRGEFLEALRDAGISHKGLDLEPDMVEHCRGLGLDVEQGSAHDYLAGLPDGMLGGVFLGQVVEHMSPADQVELLRLCAAKIRPNGTFIAETPNPICPVALANFFIDPTHVRPVHPELFAFLAEEAGFGDIEFRYTSPLGDKPDPLITRVAQAAGTDRYMDYALIGRVPAGERP